jgi:ATP-dependent Clp protease ATP-binding subunit ClpC
MDFSEFNLTPSAKACLIKSQSIAEELGHLKVIDLHLFSSIMDNENINIDNALSFCEISKDGLNQAIFSALCSYKEPKRKKKIYAEEVLEILESSFVISRSLKHEYIGVDHIFLTIINTRKEISEFLESLEIDVEKVSNVLSNFIKNGVERIPAQTGAPPKAQPQDKDTMWSCCENINEKIRKRGTFEIFGRDKEIDRAFEVLLRKNKSNVIFVGDAGVGKTAIVEGMAEKIVERKCPDLLLHKEIISLDIASVVSGTIYRGQMEEKIKNIIDSLKTNKQYVLFIDEIHTIIGSGTSSEGGLDMANILKPALSRGEISCIGATTSEEYKSFFKKDSALDRRFENIEVKEPSKEEVEELLLKAKTSYEEFHTVEYSEEIIKLIIDLCDYYLPLKKFPDKAFDILDESGAKTKKTHIIRPKEAKDLEKDMIKAQSDTDTKVFDKLHKKYEAILKKWGEKLEKTSFSVDKQTIYDIFANKLNVDAKTIENKSTIKPKGVIGF